MERNASGRWTEEGEPASGLVVLRDERPASAPGQGKAHYVVDGWEVDAETYRLYLYDREIDTRDATAETRSSAEEMIAALIEASKAGAPGTPATPRASPVPAAQPPLPAAAAGPRRFDR